MDELTRIIKESITISDKGREPFSIGVIGASGSVGREFLKELQAGFGSTGMLKKVKLIEPIEKSVEQARRDIIEYNSKSECKTECENNGARKRAKRKDIPLPDYELSVHKLNAIAESLNVSVKGPEKKYEVCSISKALDCDILMLAIGHPLNREIIRDARVNGLLPDRKIFSGYNWNIIRHYAEAVREYEGHISIVSNHVNALATAFAVHSRLESGQISGVVATDELRFKYFYRQISGKSYVHGFVCGTHDNNLVIVVEDDISEEDMANLESLVKNQGKKITRDLGDTAIDTSRAMIQHIRAWLFEEQITAAVPTVVGEEELYMSMPAHIVRVGEYHDESRAILPRMNEAARKKFVIAANNLQMMVAEILTITGQDIKTHRKKRETIERTLEKFFRGAPQKSNGYSTAQFSSFEHADTIVGALISFYKEGLNRYYNETPDKDNCWFNYLKAMFYQRIVSKEKRDFEAKALCGTYFLRAVEAEPANPLFIRHSIEWLVERGRITEAEAIAKRGFEIDKNAEYLILIGEASFRLKDYRRAAMHIRDAITKKCTEPAAVGRERDLADMYYTLAVSYLMIGDYSAAEHVFKISEDNASAATERSIAAKARTGRAVALYNMGFVEKAVDVEKSVIEEYGPDIDAESELKNLESFLEHNMKMAM